jgi:tRNA U55 pseudouridine synthase TruB
MAETTIQQIKDKINALVHMLEHTRQQRDVLLQENARLSENLESLKKQQNNLVESSKSLEEKLNQVQQIPVSDQQAEKKRNEIKGKIRELATEIDKCIALLNHENQLS